MFNKFHKNKNNSGVTLIELIIVISIFLIISTTVILNRGKLNSSLSTQNLVDDIALSIRKVQSYAIGVQSVNNSFDYGYGIHFVETEVDYPEDKSNDFDGSKKAFILFVDIDGNEEYDNNSSCGVPGSECLEVISINTQDSIKEFSVDGGSPINSNGPSVDIIFKRPNPEPEKICVKNAPSSPCNNNVSYVTIKVSSDSDPSIFKIITVYKNGQISAS